MAEGRDPKQYLRLKNRPKDLQIMANILKEMGVEDYEPGVLNHMLEFSHRYVTTIFNEAFVYSRHAGKQSIDADDVKLAIQIYHERIANPPSKDLIEEVAKQKNSSPLAPIKSNAGLRLPSDRHSLTACNYRVKTPPKKPKFHVMPGVKLNNLSCAKIFPSSPSSRTTGSLMEPMDTSIVQYSDVHTVSSTVPDPPAIPEVTPVSAVTTMPQILLPSFGVASASSSQMLLSSMGIISTSMSHSEDGLASSTTHIHMPTTVPMNTEIVNSGEATPMFKEEDKEQNDDYDDAYDLECSNEQYDME